MENRSIFHGTLQEIRIPEILFNLSRRKETGALHIQRDNLEKTLYFDEGKLVFSSSNDADERLGFLLLRRGKITYQQLLECAPKVVPGKRLGTILVLDGIIQPTDLYHGVIDQIKEIIYSVFDWDTGKFEFESSPLTQKEVITLSLSTPDLIMTGMQRIWRWSWIQKSLPALDIVYRKCEGWSPVVRKMTMTREMEGILDLFDRPRTLEEVLQISSLGNFETCRLIWTFLILAIIEEILVAPVWAKDQQESAPSAIIGVSPALSTQEMPTPQAVTTQSNPENKEGPTLKLRIDEQLPSAEATPRIEPQDFELLLVEPVPCAELSFSDLNELREGKQNNSEYMEPEIPSLQSWEFNVQPDLKRLNELHRYLYEMINLELGNGTNAFLSKIFRKASIKYPLVFESVSMNDFGELSESVLLENIQGNLVQDYQKALDFLITEERSMINMFLDTKRVDVIEAGLKRLLERRNQAST